MPTDDMSLPPVPSPEWANTGSASQPASSMRDLDAELLYCLDCAVELGEISPIDYVLFRHDTPPARALLAQRNDDKSWSAHWLRNTARHYFDQLALEERYVVALHAMVGLGSCIRALHERMEFVVEQKCLRDLGVIPDVSRLLRDHEPELIASIPAVVFEGVSSITRERVQQFADPLFAQAVSRLEADIELTREALLWASTADGPERAREVASRVLQTARPAPLTRIRTEHLDPRSMAIERRKKEGQAKSAIKKALKLITSLGVEQETRLLVSGEEVRIAHPDSPFQFLLKAHKHSGWLIERTVNPGGHVPYRLTLQTKDGRSLANLCVIFKDTPVLDQLLALTMFVQTGDEQALLEKANWFGVDDREMVVQYLASHAPALVPKVRERLGAGSLIVQQEEDTFWQPYKGPVRSWVGEFFEPAISQFSRIQRSLAEPIVQRALA